VTATIVVFATDGAPLGPVLVGLFGALLVSHLLHPDWRKLLANAGAHSLSMAAGIGVLLALPRHWLDEVPLLIVGATLASLVAYFVNILCVGLGVAYAARRPFRHVFQAFAELQWHVYPWALLGTGLGWLQLRVGVVPVVLAVTPLLIGRRAFASYVHARESRDATLRTLVQVLESKDRYTAGHAERVAAYAQLIGEELRLRPRALERLRHAALMHDIGKLVVPNHLLNKPGRLTPVEYERVRVHEDVTVDLLGRIEFLAPVAPIALGVYGEPDSGEERRLDLERHIVAVADAYDAMTSTRSYRRALSQDVAFGELRENAGRQFHPRCVDALIVGIERRGLRHGAGHEPLEAAEEFAVAPPVVGPGSAGLGDLDESATPSLVEERLG
jgi:hypothetical protein